MGDVNAQDPPLLSELVANPLSRRFFLQKATIAGAAMAAASCKRPEEREKREEEHDAESEGGPGVMNSNSRADTALGIERTPSSHTPAAGAATAVAEIAGHLPVDKPPHIHVLIAARVPAARRYGRPLHGLEDVLQNELKARWLEWLNGGSHHSRLSPLRLVA